MQILLLLAKLLPAILQLMDIAEKVFTEPKSGENKKAWVMGAAQAIVSGAQSASTGGQKETWDAIAAIASPIIDKASSIAFPSAAMNTYQGPQ